MCACGKELTKSSKAGMCAACYQKQLYWKRINSDPDARAKRNAKLTARRKAGKEYRSPEAHQKRMAAQRRRV